MKGSPIDDNTGCMKGRQQSTNRCCPPTRQRPRLSCNVAWASRLPVSRVFPPRVPPHSSSNLTGQKVKTGPIPVRNGPILCQRHAILGLWCQNHSKIGLISVRNGPIPSPQHRAVLNPQLRGMAASRGNDPSRFRGCSRTPETPRPRQPQRHRQDQSLLTSAPTLLTGCQPISTRRMDVYWFDDRGGVRLPKACRLKYCLAESGLTRTSRCHNTP